MRQVPHIHNYLLIGGGKVAKHMSRYFDLLEIPYSIWSRKLHDESQLISHLKMAQTVLLLISDDQILDFYEKHQRFDNQFVHFSGAFEHSNILGFHPLMSFGEELYDLEIYKKLQFVGTSSELTFRQVFPKIKNHYSKIATDKKAFYHSLCVLGGNGTTLLWDLMATQFKSLGIPKTAVDAYLNQITKNILEDKPGRFTGPWYRNDQQTIAKNKEALQSGTLLDLYNELEKLSATVGNKNEKHS